MPIYEYLCNACRHEFDKLQSFTSPTTIECPHCKEKTAKRLVSAPSFRLTGSGWYETDFKNPKKADKKTDESQPKSKEKSESKSGGDKTKSTEPSKTSPPKAVDK